MRTNKIILVTDKGAYTYTLKQEFNMPIETWKNKCTKLVKENEVIKHVYDARYFHVCRYCGQIAIGANSDVLCKECRELFGHSYFSEL